MDNSKPRKNPTSSRASCARTGAARESNARYVQTGVATIVMQRSTDGWMYAHVENIGLPVQLKTSQRLRELLLALCGRVSHVNRPEQGLVPFKTSEEVIDLGKHAVVNRERDAGDPLVARRPRGLGALTQGALGEGRSTLTRSNTA